MTYCIAFFKPQCYNLNIMKIETHLHSNLGSDCGLESYSGIVNAYKNLGYGAIILTEHFSHYIINHFFTQETYADRIKAYLNNYKKFEKTAKEIGIKAFFGLEFTFNFDFGKYADILVYGVDDKFFLENDLLSLSLEQFFKCCKKHNLFTVQAHPFRPNVKLVEPKLLDGVEVYNGHFGHKNCNEKAEEYANATNLKKMSGTDFHAMEQAGRGGIIVPDSIANNKELVDYLKNNKLTLIKDGKV